MSDELFWTAADPFVESGEAQAGTIMGHPCLRTAEGGPGGRGEFVAMPYGELLVVKLNADRVNELVEAGQGTVFDLTGRTFREWVTVEERDAARWRELIAEGLALRGASARAAGPPVPGAGRHRARAKKNRPDPEGSGRR